MNTATIRADKTGTLCFFNWFTRLKEKYAEYQNQTRTIKELESLSDLQLRDIGLGRCDIQSIATQVAKGGAR